MVAIRHPSESTLENLLALVGLINNPCSKKVVLFASPDSKAPEMSPSDGPENNLPLLAAFVEYEIPKIDSVVVIFDGLFLTAARYPRYDEVRELLDLAQKSDKVFFSETRAPFTSSLSAEDAAKTLQSLLPIKRLTPETRADYFSLLHTWTEARYQESFSR